MWSVPFFVYLLSVGQVSAVEGCLQIPHIEFLFDHRTVHQNSHIFPVISFNNTFVGCVAPIVPVLTRKVTYIRKAGNDGLCVSLSELGSWL